MRWTMIVTALTCRGLVAHRNARQEGYRVGTLPVAVPKQGELERFVYEKKQEYGCDPVDEEVHDMVAENFRPPEKVVQSETEVSEGA